MDDHERLALARVGSWAMAVLPGDLDLTCVAQVRAGLDAALADGVSVLIVDMSRTGFCDSAGVRALVGVHRRAVACGTQLRLVVPSAVVRRVFTLMGVDELLPVHEALDTAMADAPDPPRPG